MTIADLIHRHRSDVLLPHPLDDVHPDHRATAEAVLAALTEHFDPMTDNLSALWGARIGTARAEAFRPPPILGLLPATTHL